ncbi:MAG: alpha/beta hydrolase-fold protein [Anaerolineales bacterium]
MSQIIIEEFHSRALQGNPLGDPVVRRVPVYLPDGYETGSQRYPSVYLLAGFTGRGLKMLNDSLWDETMPQRLDRLMRSGAVRPMIVVMPDASTRYGGSQYRNSSATGNYEDHILELVAWIDARYRTIADPNFRGVAGKSSGGYGATWLGMHHPDVFGLVADHSGDKYFELCYKPDFPAFLRYYARTGEEGIRKMLANPGAVRPKDGAFFGALNIAAMASCYSPNPDAPLGFDLPFDPYSGELRPQVWTRWLESDPVHLVAEYAEALRSLKVLFFDCGTRDEYNLQYGARIFAQRLKAHGIPFIHQEFDDGHRDINYRYDISLIAFSEAMKARA